MSIIDTFIPPYQDIVDLEYYTKLYNKPHTEKEAIQNEQFSKLLIQVTDQINVLCGGRVYDEWAKLDDTIQADAKRKFWLRRAVCAYLEYCIDTAHIFVNKQFQSSGTLPFSVNASANDANFENVRHDIIKLLKQGYWYQTLYGINPTDKSCGEMSKIDYNNQLTWLVEYLKSIFKTIDNTNQFTNGLVLSNQEITTAGNITAYSNLSKLVGFDLSQSNIPQLLNYLTKQEASTTYQTINDEALLTTDKTIVGAINELFNTAPSQIIWDTTPTAEHGEGYAVTSAGIKTYVDTKETNLQSQINTKQNATDNNLQTTSKNIVGAINEINAIKISSQNDNEVEIQSTSSVGGLNVGQATIDFQNPTIQTYNLSVGALPYSTTTTLVNCRYVSKTATSFTIEVVWVGNTTEQFIIETIWINRLREEL